MNKIELSIVIPCYNEAENIPLVLEKFKKVYKINKNTELILVDNNSKDNTKEVLKKLLKKKEYAFARTVFQPIPGYGAAVYKGLKSAKGEFIGWTHGDIQTPPEDAIKAFELIEKQKNPKLAYIKGKRYGRPLFDIFFTFGMSVFDSVILNTALWDINAQPNLFHKSFLKLMKKPPEDFSFDLYTYYLAKKNNYEIKRFNVYFGKRIYGESAWNTGWKQRYKFIKRTVDFTFKLKRMLKKS